MVSDSMAELRKQAAAAVGNWSVTTAKSPICMLFATSFRIGRGSEVGARPAFLARDRVVGMKEVLGVVALLDLAEGVRGHLAGISELCRSSPRRS